MSNITLFRSKTREKKSFFKCFFTHFHQRFQQQTTNSRFRLTNGALLAGFG